MAARWHRLSGRDLKHDPGPLVEFYDQLTELCGPLGEALEINQPMQLVLKGRVAMYRKGAQWLAEVDERMVELLHEKCKGPFRFVTGQERVDAIVWDDIRYVGTDPRSRYPKCKGWYGRKIKGKTRARALLKLPLKRKSTTPSPETPKSKKQTKSERAAKKKSRIRRRMLRV